MKKSLLNSLVGGFLLAMLVTSCSTSNDVVSNSWIQKRKYNKGYFIDTKGKEVKPATEVETLVTEEISTPAGTEEKNVSTLAVAPVATNQDVADNSGARKNEVSSGKEKHNILNKGLAGKSFNKGKKEMQKSKEAYKEYKLSEASAVGAVGYGMSHAAKKKSSGYLKKAIWSAIIAVVFFIIAVVLAAARASKAVTTGTATGFGAATVFYIIGVVFWVIAVVFFIMWLVDKFS